MDRYTRANLDLWQEWTALHVDSEFYDVPAFRAGKCTLKPLEVEELGDVSGKSLLHLQCHFGLDTLSWARRGARITGVDFSPRAVEAARALASELDIPANFVHSRVQDLAENLEGEFDIVYTSFGVLSWIEDLDDWARVIAHFLRRGGTFYIAEMHPFAQVFDDETQEKVLRPRYPYFPRATPMEFQADTSYAAPHADGKTLLEYNWVHSVGEIVNALIGAGLVIEQLNEHRWCPYRMFPFLIEEEGGRWRMPDDMPEIPLLFSLRATR